MLKNMIRTIVKTSVKNNHFSLHFDDGSKLKLPLLVELTGKYGYGVKIDDRRFNELLTLSEEFECYNCSLKYISTSLKSEKQLHDYLKKKMFSSTNIQKSIKKLKADNYLNDKLFAEQYVLSLTRRKVVGRIYIENKLLQKGIDKNTIAEVLESQIEYFDNDDALYELACSRYENLNRKQNKKQSLYEKVGMSLQRLGFQTARIIRVLDKMKNNGYKF
jgi:regulatory protein